LENGDPGNVTFYGEANYYELLEVEPEASRFEIEQAYRQQMELLSGDSLATYGLFVGEDLVHARTRVEEAYRVLCDPDRRRAYDLSAFDRSVVAEGTSAEQYGAGVTTPKTSAAEAAEALLADAMSTADGMADAAAPDLVDEPEEASESPAVEAAARRDKSGKAAERIPASPPPSVAFGTLDGPAGPAQPASPEKPGGREKPAGSETRSLPKVPGWKGSGQTPPKAPPASKPARREVPSVDIQAFDGLSMKAAREQQGISRNDISLSTRIAEYYIEYIEEERFNKLPPVIYLRAYLRQYAEAIGADPEKTVTGYLERYNASKGH